MGHTLDKAYEFKTGANTALLEFVFCVGNPRGIDMAKRLAKRIVVCRKI